MAQPGQRVVDACMASEGLMLVAYQKPNDPRVTIGWGRTSGVKLGDTCTREQATVWLAQDLQTACNQAMETINRGGNTPTRPLDQGKIDAITDFVFNLGIHRLETSSLLLFIRHGALWSAAAEFGKWIHDEYGNVLGGLVKRRALERAWFTESWDTVTDGTLV